MGHTKVILKAALFSVSYFALAIAGGNSTSAQTPQQAPTAQSGASQLPPVQIEEPKRKPRRQRSQPSNRAGAAAARRPTTPQPAPQAQPSVWASSPYDARTGTVGIYTNSTSVATKINTPLLNIPQSISVLTKDFIRDQGFSQLTDVTRYVPGVAVHQGEGNRDEFVIRGCRFKRKLFRQRISGRRPVFPRPLQRPERRNSEGPGALTFGRGAGGGLLNRTLKEADGSESMKQRDKPDPIRIGA